MFYILRLILQSFNFERDTFRIKRTNIKLMVMATLTIADVGNIFVVNETFIKRTIPKIFDLYLQRFTDINF